MLRKYISSLFIVFILFNFSSCTLLQKPIDKRSGFSRQLQQVEEYVRNEDWTNANSSLEVSNHTWKKIKPWLQIDIDHDYVNDIEKEFIKLKGYVETNEKPDAVASVLLIQDVWQNISSF